MSITPEDHKSATFTHTFASGRHITLPRFEAVMTFGRARKMRKLEESEQMFALVEEICDELALSVLDEMDLTETKDFFDAWQADSGVSLGESSPSST